MGQKSVREMTDIARQNENLYLKNTSVKEKVGLSAREPIRKGKGEEKYGII